MRKIGFPATAALLALALAGCKSGSGGVVDQAAVARGNDGTYAITWNASGGPVDVYVADRADAPKEAMRLLVDDDTDGKASVAFDGKTRPYFYVAADGGSGLWAAERVLPLEGGRNFRDMGGYATADGKRVKWGKLFRSGSMAGLTPADYRYLSGLGIKAVCDLRTEQERSAEPNKWVQAAKIDYWTRDYTESGGDLGSLLISGATRDKLREAMIATYRALPVEQAPAYREIFLKLAAGEIPLAFNCSAGKDRAGTAAALILSALGVPDETVFADYAMSDKILDFNAMLTDPKAAQALGPLAKLPRDVLAPLMASDPAYIRAAFATIREKYGSVTGYLNKELGIDDAQLAKIRGALLD